MATPSPPFLTGNQADDTQAILRFLTDFYRSLIVVGQVTDRADRIAKVDVSHLTVASGTVSVAQFNALVSVVQAIVAAAQIQ